VRFKAYGHDCGEIGIFNTKEEAQAAIDALPKVEGESYANINEHYDRTWLCIEHGEHFYIDAKDLNHAREVASLWGAEVIKEIKE